MSALRTPRGPYDFGGDYSHLSTNGDGSKGKGKPRAWDASKRPVTISITNYRGYPHYFVRLREAENPYLGMYDGHRAWISEWDDPELRGRSVDSHELGSREEAIAWAEEAYAREFGEERYVLFREWAGERVVNIRDLIEKEGD